MKWFAMVLEAITGVGLALLLRRYVCVLAYVKGRSMQDTLSDGEIVFALRRGLNGEIHRFDVVLCKYPNRKGLFVKRVVGLPGESLRIEEGVLYINDEAMEEVFSCHSRSHRMTERVVPKNSFFVLGDNRMASRDSRSVGAIEGKDVVAVVKCVLFPFRKIRKIY